MTGENDAPTLGVELRPHPQAHLVGLPAKQLGVSRPHEGVHAIETLWCRAGRQPFEIAVGTRDITVRAGRDVDDDFARRHALKNSAANLVPRPHPEAIRHCSDRKSTRLNSSHLVISYAVFCLKKKKHEPTLSTPPRRPTT